MKKAPLYSYKKPHLQLWFWLALFSAFVMTACGTQANEKRPVAFNTNWQIISAAEIASDGSLLSSSKSQEGKWVKTDIPTTVMGALVNAGVYKDVFLGDNLAKIPEKSFQNPWWFRKEFSLQNFNVKQEHLSLCFDGLNYRADVWLNGKQIASEDTLYGAFRQFTFDISSQVTEHNVLAVKIYPPQPRDFYMGFVDWAPTPPDKYMGLYRDVRLQRTGLVTAEVPFVATDVNTKTLGDATVSISSELTNHDKKEKNIVVQATIQDIKISKKITLAPHSTTRIKLSANDYPQLKINHPHLWWPNGLGDPYLYKLDFRVLDGTSVSDQHKVNFGIRKVETYINDHGARGYMVNGRKVLIKSGGWVDDLFLRYNPTKDAAQIRYVKEMNMNSIRLEGFWGNNQHLYDLCDANGILMMVGFSCQWEWPDYLGQKLAPGAEDDESATIAEGAEKYGVKISAEEEKLLSDYFHDQVTWLRNHPSIICWAVGSDAMPKPSLESKYQQTLAQYDTTRSLLISAGGFVSDLSGTSGMKMLGPYQYVPPVYWFEDKKWGGAFGFNSETGPGPQIPPVESIQKMIPQKDLWPPQNAMWNFHSGRKEFHDLKVYMTALNNRYGTPKDLEELAFKAQLMNYEAIRPMFEAFVINRPVATGVVQWMLNSPWPEFYWQLYDYYLMPTGAYFGTQKACQPTSLIYNYHDHQVYASHDGTTDLAHAKATIKLYDVKSNVIFEKTAPVTLGKNDIKAIGKLPQLKDPHGVYFLSLTMNDGKDAELANNFYWLSAKKDALDYDKTVWYYTPQKEYADFTAINTMEKTAISATKKIVRRGREWEMKVTLSNPSEKLAFFVELTAVKKSDGTALLPVFWSDNYVSLPPGSHKEITVKFYEDALGQDEPAVKIQGVNLAEQIKI